MSTIAAFCPLSGTPMLDRNGAPMRGGQVLIFNAETTTPRAAYQDFALQVPHVQPIKTNAWGRIPQIYLDAGDYKVVLKAPDGTLLDSYEHLPGATQTVDNNFIATGYTTGDLKPSYVPAPQDGWLVANGGTIGNGTSSATARANDDTQPLFTAIWNADPSLVVSPQRGASATLDFLASKTIALPDLRGRVFVGVDKMGAAATAGRITGASTPQVDQVGSTFGAETTALSVAQLPTFTPQVQIGAAGGHTHTATAAAAGGHTHTGVAGNHGHSYTSFIPSGTSYVAGGGGVPVVNGANYGSGTGGSSPPLAVDAVADHTHAVTLAAAADHIHTATASPIGNGAAHLNMPPSVLGYWHIRL